MNIQQMIHTVKMARNPQMMIQTMVRSNPAMKQAMDYINANGGDAEQAFYRLADEKGVDPQEILNSLK